ncbi:MAG TPA: hypothetical protein P5089_02500 [Candidatus Portnoybacteria bacterium]|nr:hypothetical protein [Candidatus Portnoybacteria bacterium]
MRKDLIESYLLKLRASFGGLKSLVEGDELELLYQTRNYAGMVSSIKRIFCLDLRIMLGLVNRGGLDAPAWVKWPKSLPLYGSDDFQQTIVIIYLRKSFLGEASFEPIVVAIAHELSHIILYAFRHELCRQEEAVDLLAMLLGFRDFYVTGCKDISFQGDNIVTHRLGYLSEEEILYASQFMTFNL